MMGVESCADHLDAPAILAALLDEFSAVTDYRTLRDNLPRRLAALLQCRCILLYQRVDETLQFASGSFADQPGWSSTLLAVAHINPIELHSDMPEAQAWRTRRAVIASLAGVEHALTCAPLMYRQRPIGVLSALRSVPDAGSEGEILPRFQPDRWLEEELPLVAVAANVVAMLLENTRLLERDRERIQELSLLNSITSQMNCSLHERARVQRIAVQRAREIAALDLCAVPLFGADVGDGEEAWLPVALRDRLARRWQQDMHAAPLIVERVGEIHDQEYMDTLSPRIKTFFAIPLLANRERSRARGSTLPYLPRREDPSAHVLGLVVGAYYRPYKLRREELVLLQILANQASAVLENIALMDEVVEARNEARRLLRQVLDDQRLKELILENISSGLLTIDMQERITTFNRAAETVLGYHPLEVLGQPVRKILALGGLENILLTGRPQRETLLASGRQGQEIVLDITLAPLRDDRGEQVGVLATFADVTAMHRLEEEKRRLDRLASLGEMSASVAHEVRNPLASIKTSMQLLRTDLEGQSALQGDEGIQGEVAVVLQEVERLDHIVRDLLLFARPRHLHLVECDLGELSERILRFLQPQCAERGVHVRQVRQHLPLARVDTAQMEQVLLNLFLNALQAMPDGGLLSVSCQIAQQADCDEHLSPSCSSGQCSTYTALLAGEYLDAPEKEPVMQEKLATEHKVWFELTISDTGTGIAPEDLERIFQPFHTTRAHGIGLGLPITRRLIEDHQGEILVESQLGYGTTITVRLPLLPANAL